MHAWLNKARIALVKLGAKCGIKLRQPYTFIGVNRKVRAWYAECFAEWKTGKVHSSWPQVWSFPQYTICHRHNVSLQSKCGACGATFSSDRLWKGALDQCPRCNAALYVRSQELVSGGEANSSVIRKIPGYDELVGHALGDLVASFEQIAKEGLEIGTKFSMLLTHCQKYELVNTSSDLARISGLSRPTIHNLEHNEHAPYLGNLLRIAVTCEVSLAGLLCSDLWGTTANGLKVEGRTVHLPESGKRVYYDRDAIEKQVLAAIDQGTPEVPWVMARAMGLCERQFCLKLARIFHAP